MLGQNCRLGQTSVWRERETAAAATEITSAAAESVGPYYLGGGKGESKPSKQTKRPWPRMFSEY